MRFLCLLFALAPLRALACDLALVLAVDISGSVDSREFRVQMGGLAAALEDGVVIDALVAAQARVTLIQWSGSTRQRQTVPWTAITDADSAARLAQRIRDDARVWRNFSTAVGEAIGLSLETLAEVPECRRRIIDVSGDGVSNEGPLPQVHRSALRQMGVTVNALAIETDATDLTAWFFEHLIFGENAFVITAAGFDDYPAQILRKLQREITRKVSDLTP